LSETAPLELVFFFAWVLPPGVSLVDWGMKCFLVRRKIPARGLRWQGQRHRLVSDAGQFR
jgi:hypothetical protein